MKFIFPKFVYIYVDRFWRESLMKLESLKSNAFESPRSGNKDIRVKITEKNGVVTKTTVTNDNGVKTTVVETTYPDGRIQTKTTSSGCGMRTLGTVNLGTVHVLDNSDNRNSVFDITDENAHPLVSDALKSTLEQNGKIVPSVIVDDNGKVKPDYYVFDLNGDGRLGDNEFSWFAHGGAISADKNLDEISYSNFESSMNALDMIKKGSSPDGIITNQERISLHNMLDAPEKYY